MRGLDTPIRKIRREVFKEISRVAFESTEENFQDRIEAIPYEIVRERATYRESIYRERAVASERVRLAMGMSLRPENQAVHITAGMEASNIDEKYYEPPLMQVIPSACDACEPNMYMVSDMCRGCVAHPCRQVCPKGAITIRKGKSIIDQENAFTAENARRFAPMTPFRTWKDPAPEPAASTPSRATDRAGR